jgi:hypothetical protein
MTKKRMALFAALPLIIAVIFGVLAMLPPDTRPGVTKANFDRIEKGMTLAEVEEIFGREGMMLSRTVGNGGKRTERFLWRAEDWSNSFSSAVVVFEDDHVVDADNWNTETFPNKIRRWLQLPRGN